MVSVSWVDSSRAVTGACIRWFTTGERLRTVAARLGAVTGYETRGAMTQITTPPAFDAAAASTAYRNALEVIGAVEPDVAAAMRQELTDQRESLKLIASENYASPAVLLAMGTWLTDKYAEGTIGHRFYAGCQNVDTVEQLAADHAASAVRRTARLRPAALGHRRQPGRVLGDPRPARRGARAREPLASARQRPLRRGLGGSCGAPSATSGCSACRSTPAAT